MNTIRRAALAALVLCPALHAAEPGPTAAGVVDRDGRWVFIDPITRDILARPPRDALQMERPDGIPGDEPVLRVLPNGFELLETPGRLHMQTATVDADGHVEATCRDAHHLHPLRRTAGQDGSR